MVPIALYGVRKRKDLSMAKSDYRVDMCVSIYNEMSCPKIRVKLFKNLINFQNRRILISYLPLTFSILDLIKYVFCNRSISI